MALPETVLCKATEKCYWKFWLNADIEADENLSDQIQGKLLFQWPYTWEDPADIKWSVVESLHRDMTSWLVSRLGPTHGSPPRLIKDCATFAYFTLPSSWKGFEEVQGSRNDYYRKVLLYAKFFILVFVIDDICEDRNGVPGHNLFMEEMAESAYDIFMLKYQSMEEVLEDLNANYGSDLKLPEFAKKHALWFDVAEELRTDFGYTSEETKFFARSFQRTWDHHTWLGSSDYSQTRTVEEQRYFRVQVGGAIPTFELVLLVEGILVPERIRERKYWIRFVAGIADLIHLSNDVFSYLKEKDGGGVDSSIMALIRANCGVKEAFDECCKRQDKILKTHSDIYLYLKSLERGRGPGRVDEEFLMAFGAANFHVGHFIQGQYYMDRYTTFSYEFITDEGVI